MNSLPSKPILRTPLNDFLSTFGDTNLQKHGLPQCKRFEMKYMDCVEGYGIERGYVDCKNILEDLLECQHGIKQEWRFDQLRAERLRQIKEGKLEEKYMKSPAPEIIHPLV